MDGRIMKYNPAFLSKEELVEKFVVRHAELDLIVQAIRENTGESNQHLLVIGPRGIGKTMLVLRAAEEVRRQKDLSERWYPLVFAEESYQVTTPGEFWLEAIFHLAQKTQDPRWKAAHEELQKEPDENRLRERALAQLLDFADAQGKRLLLVVENLNMLLGEQMTDDDGWILRYTLLHEPRIMLLTTATNRFEQLENAGKPMFELFRMIALEALSQADCSRMWTSISGETPADNRIRPIQILTGGNPRLVAIISSFGARMSFQELMTDLIRLVDDHTEYFKSHLDSLASTERKVYLALVELWDPAGARDVAEAARLNVNKASALLRRLVERGAVVEVGGTGRKKSYQVAERMYNIYYLIRRQGGASRRVRAVVNFMVAFYREEELITAAQRMVEEACRLEPEYRQDHLCAYEALVRNADGGTRRKLIAAAPRDFFHMPDIPEFLRCLIASKEESTRAFLDVIQAMFDAHTHGITGDSIGEQIAKAVAQLRRALKVDPQDTTLWILLGTALSMLPDSVQEADHAYRRAIQADPCDANAWLALGVFLRSRMRHIEDSEQALHKAAQLDGSARIWTRIGSLYARDKECAAAEKAFRTALEVDSRCEDAWYGLATLLAEALDRCEESETAYRKVLELNNKHARAWIGLGRILEEKSGRYEDAEVCYHKATEVDAQNTAAWSLLADLLANKLNRPAEAEQAYRRVIEIEPNHSTAWTELGKFLCGLGRHDEAEEVFKKAIALNPDDEVSLIGLAFVQMNAQRYAEAEPSIRHAMAMRPDDGFIHACLGMTLRGLGRCSEAVEAYKRAIAANGDQYWAVLLLGDLLISMGREDETLELLAEYREKSSLIHEHVRETTELIVHLAAAGRVRRLLDVLDGSPIAENLEPLIIGLRLSAGEDVKAAAEIMEVAKDVVKRIEDRRAKLDSSRAEQGQNEKEDTHGGRKL